MIETLIGFVTRFLDILVTQTVLKPLAALGSILWTQYSLIILKLIKPQMLYLMKSISKTLYSPDAEWSGFVADYLNRLTGGLVKAEDIQKQGIGISSSAANTANLIWYLSGAGMHWGIYFWLTSTGICDNDYIRVIADGSTINLPTFKEGLDNNFTMPIGSECWITLYDSVNFKFGGVGAAGKTWSQYHSGYYVETHGRTPYAKLKFIYSIF